MDALDEAIDYILDKNGKIPRAQIDAALLRAGHSPETIEDLWIGVGEAERVEVLEDGPGGPPSEGRPADPVGRDGFARRVLNFVVLLIPLGAIHPRAWRMLIVLGIVFAIGGFVVLGNNNEVSQAPPTVS